VNSKKIAKAKHLTAFYSAPDLVQVPFKLIDIKRLLAPVGKNAQNRLLPPDH